MDRENTSAAKKRIVILGGGFAGAYTALHLEKQFAGSPDIEVILLCKENFLLFTPMLHEVAGSDVSVTDIVQPLRKMLRHTRMLIAEVKAIDLGKKEVRAFHEDSGRTFEVTYDQLVLARGRGDELLPHTRPRTACADHEDAGRRHPRAQPRHRASGIGGQPGG